MAAARAVTGSGIDFVSAYTDVAARLVATIPSCDTGARVPACPGWSAYDLVVHLGNIHAWAATIVETRRAAPHQDDHPRAPRAPVVAQWYSGKAEDLLAVLREADPSDECWTFAAGDRTVGFWLRRQTHETLVHTVDLHQSAGRTTDLDPALAADAVAEVLEVFLPRMQARGRPAVLTEPLVVRATDTEDTWTLTPRADGAPAVVRGDHADDLVEAPATELMQVLWKRLPYDHDSVRFCGDLDRVLAFLRSPLTP